MKQVKGKDRFRRRAASRKVRTLQRNQRHTAELRCSKLARNAIVGGIFAESMVEVHGCALCEEKRGRRTMRLRTSLGENPLKRLRELRSRYRVLRYRGFVSVPCRPVWPRRVVDRSRCHVDCLNSRENVTAEPLLCRGYLKRGPQNPDYSDLRWSTPET